MSYQQHSANGVKGQSEPYILKEDEKIPLFLVKLWNIVEDPAYYDVIRWDESGYSFHIMDPYSFCRNVLPQYFKHNNLNSLIRQLNMYGFRKMTPIERTSLARAESDQDHLEFSHPYFVRDHPEQLVNIKRKAPSTRQHSDQNTVSIPAKDLTAVLEELRQLRERQKNMEAKMSELVNENEMIWQEMGMMRGQHNRQTQIVNKLVQFLVTLVQPKERDRIGKRQLYAIDEIHAKRPRTEAPSGSSTSVQAIQTHNNINEVLDRLMSDLSRGGLFTRGGQVVPFNNDQGGPIIADVTDELEAIANASQQAPEYYVEPPSTRRQRVPSTKVQQPPQQPQFMQQPQTAAYYHPVTSSIATQPTSPISNPTNVTPHLQLRPDMQNVSRQKPPQRHYQTAPPPMKNEMYTPLPQVTMPAHSPVMQQNMPMIQGQAQLREGQLPPVSNGGMAHSGEDPLIASPGSCLGLSPSDFADYLSGMDTDINKCRDLIGGQWDDLDIEGLLDDAGGPSPSSDGGHDGPENNPRTTTYQGPPRNVQSRETDGSQARRPSAVSPHATG